jgi:periplasmic protein TonB
VRLLHTVGGEGDVRVRLAGRIIGAVVLMAAMVFGARAQESASPPAPGQVRPVPTRVRVSQGVMRALIIKSVEPVYPAEAKKKHVEGNVVIQFIVSKTGEPSALRLISGDELLAPAAMDALRQWRYKPYVLNGQPIEVETQSTFIFSQ